MQTPTCPKCRRKRNVMWVSDFLMWYCFNCSLYFSRDKKHVKKGDSST